MFDIFPVNRYVYKAAAWKAMEAKIIMRKTLGVKAFSTFELTVTTTYY